MVDAQAVAFIGIGIVGAVTAVGSLFYQGIQTNIMRTQVEKAFDPEGEGGTKGTAFERRLRAHINRRLTDVRYELRSEYKPRLASLEDQLKTINYQTLMQFFADIGSRQATAATTIEEKVARAVEVERFGEELAINLHQVLEEAERAKEAISVSEQRILAESGKYDYDIATHTQQLDSLGRQVENLRTSMNTQEQTRLIIRLIAENLLRLAS